MSVVGTRDSRPVWFDATVVGAVLFLLFLVTASYSRSQMNDAASSFTSAWAMVAGTLDMSASPAPKTWYVEIDGHLFRDRMPGIIAWAIPFYAVLGQAAAPTTFPAGVAAATATALAAALLFCLFTRLASRRTSLVAAGVFALGTSTWTVSAHVLWPHGMDQLWLIVMMLAASSRRWWAVGLASAAAIVTRPTLAVVPAVIGLAASRRARSVRPALVVGLLASAAVAALVAYNSAVFGEARLYVGSYAKFTGGCSSYYEHANALSPTFGSREHRRGSRRTGTGFLRDHPAHASASPWPAPGMALCSWLGP